MAWGHRDGTTALWGVGKVDSKLDPKGSGGLSQVKEGEGISGTVNSADKGPTFEWETASRTLVFITL